jgi:hypothetical protein
VRAPQPFLFIVGVGRSGTTLLRSLLNAHADLAVVHESRFLAWMAGDRRRYETPSGLDTERFMSDLLDNRRRMPVRVHTWEVDPHVIRASLSDARPADLASAIRTLYGCYAAAKGKSRYGDKTPAYVHHLRTIGRLLPEARFVHLVRDGRDVALSMLDVDFGGENIPHAAWLWARRVGVAHEAGTSLGPSRYLVVRYEDLVADPERELRTICDFIALGFDPGMTCYFERHASVVDGLGGQQHHQHLALPVTRGLRDWRTQMRPADVARFERVAGSMLRELGYEYERPRGGFGERITTAFHISRGRVRAQQQARRRVDGKR